MVVLIFEKLSISFLRNETNNVRRPNVSPTIINIYSFFTVKEIRISKQKVCKRYN